jgi:hypothetical protein
MDGIFRAALSRSCETFEVDGERLHVGMLPEIAMGSRILFGYIEVQYSSDSYRPVSRHLLPPSLPASTIYSSPPSLNSARPSFKPYVENSGFMPI